MSGRDSIVALVRACDYLAVSGRCVFTACSFYHTYYKEESSVDERDTTIIIAAAIFLACKVSEEVRRIRDVINVVKAAHREDVIQMDFDEVFVHMIEPLSFN